MCPSNDITSTSTSTSTTASTTAIDLAKLRHECPGATPIERKRFLDAKDGNYKKALDQLKAYLDWRTEHGLDDVYHCSSKMLPEEDDCDYDGDGDNNLDETYDDPILASTWSDDKNETETNDDIWHSCASNEESLDEIDWRFASQAALWYERSTNSKKKCAATSTTTATLPQLARILPPPRKGSSSSQHQQHCPIDQTGHRILQFLPARMDLSRASDTAFALAIALYLERKLDRDSSETMTVAIDVRGGDGWANPRPQKLLPFVQQVAGLLEQNFPERLARCVVFPIPAIGTILWRMVRVFLDPVTAQKIHLVKGDARISAPPPFGAMEAHVSRSVLEHMEELRCSSFVVAARQSAPKKNKKKHQHQQLITVA
jgi:hypothetical protein